MLRHKKKERLPERRDPGDAEAEPCAPGSIEQQLDMCEDGTLRGDEVLHHHGNEEFDEPDSDPADLDQKLYTMSIDMSEEDREGDEESGDEHSFGFQGGEQELTDQPHVNSGIPGHETDAKGKLKGT